MPVDALNRHPLVECVPNLSIGVQGPELTRILTAVESSTGVGLLNRHTDAYHNRTVLTLAGTVHSLDAAVDALVGVALDCIDLTRHSGQHPRVGAVDVLPFIPLAPAERDACVVLARDIARRIAEKHAVPVYLYGYAALDDHRRVHSRIRNIGFERLRELIRSDRRYRPDFGPAELHPTGGAIMMGARDLLVAFNVNLSGSDVAVARRIASLIRTSSGGMPGVQALGVRVGDHAQVTMNLFELESTRPIEVFREVKKLAELGGSGVAGVEFVGLVPRTAVTASDIEELPLTHSMDDRILEDQLARFLQSVGARDT